MMRRRRVWAMALLVAGALAGARADGQQALPVTAQRDTARGDRLIAESLALETARLQAACLADVQSLADWEAKRDEYRRQLREMLGLDPLPEKTDLAPVVTGRLEHEEFVVEKLHFQSRPGLYVTGNLYLPKKVDKPLPTILYVCGHGRVVVDGVPMGAKANYQHHGAWFARHGYACLTIDTLQLGEIEGIHHGTYRYGMWWWLNRGYTPAGVEAWNCIRALDYLETRPEVDKTRFGVTGRSGGGAYSWWIAALDERIRCAVPTAGITDLQNHVVEGAVEGHCDCMYLVNTYRWDYPLVAALVAPRPLLIANTDTDRIFPLDGVYRTFEQVRRLYRLHEPAQRNVSADVALNITAGGHKDTQELQTHAFRWFNHYLKDDDSLLEKPAVKFFEPRELKVFAELPADQKNTTIHETFVAAAPPPPVPQGAAAWTALRDGWRKNLREKSFRGWPEKDGALDLREAISATRDGLRFAAYDFTSQEAVPLRLFVLQRADLAQPELNVLSVLDDAGWQEFLATAAAGFPEEIAGESPPAANTKEFEALQKMLRQFPWVMTYICPRGVGPTAFDASERKQVQNRRRYYLLGQTLDGMQTYDVRRAIQAARQVRGLSSVPLWLQSERTMAGIALYASLFEPDVKRLDLYDLPTTHRDGPIFLNVQRYLDMPQALAMAAERSKIVLYQDEDPAWDYARQVASSLGWDAKRIERRKKDEG